MHSHCPSPASPVLLGFRGSPPHGSFLWFRECAAAAGALIAPPSPRVVVGHGGHVGLACALRALSLSWFVWVGRSGALRPVAFARAPCVCGGGVSSDKKICGRGGGGDVGGPEGRPRGGGGPQGHPRPGISTGHVPGAGGRDPRGVSRSGASAAFRVGHGGHVGSARALRAPSLSWVAASAGVVGPLAHFVRRRFRGSDAVGRSGAWRPVALAMLGRGGHGCAWGCVACRRPLTMGWDCPMSVECAFAGDVGSRRGAVGATYGLRLCRE